MAFTVPARCSAYLADPFPFLAAWVLSGILAIFIPVIRWNRNKQEFYDAYGYAIEYENQNQNQDNNNNGNDDGSYYPTCKWFQWRCRQQQFAYMEANGSGDGEENWSLPTWYRFLGGMTEDDRRFQEEMGVENVNSEGALTFVYVWTMLLFIGVLVYGGFILYKQRAIGGLIVVMAILSQFALLSLILLAHGVILTDDRDLEDDVYGWYGQFSVLMVYTNFWYIIFCITFTVALLVRACCRDKQTSEAIKSFTDKNTASVKSFFSKKSSTQNVEKQSEYTEPTVEYKSAVSMNMT
jgi:hypothetical protein